jgi:hypothetical protein
MCWLTLKHSRATVTRRNMGVVCLSGNKAREATGRAEQYLLNTGAESCIARFFWMSSAFFTA